MKIIAFFKFLFSGRNKKCEDSPCKPSKQQKPGLELLLSQPKHRRSVSMNYDVLNPLPKFLSDNAADLYPNLFGNETII
jgi:hypothetical protein